MKKSVNYTRSTKKSITINDYLYLFEKEDLLWEHYI